MLVNFKKKAFINKDPDYLVNLLIKDQDVLAKSLKDFCYVAMNAFKNKTETIYIPISIK
jgi:hypothetical protein